jgi:hypothetical protein
MKFIKNNRNELFIFLVLLVSYAYFFPRWANWSQNSRLNLVLAIVDDETLAIDNYYQSSGDYFCFDRETQQGGCEHGGRVYSDKAPGVSFLAVPVYAIFRPILNASPVQQLFDTVGRNPAFANSVDEGQADLQIDRLYTAAVLYLVTVITISIPAAFLGVILYRFLGFFDTSGRWRIGVVLLYGLATSAFPYSGAFYGHQLIAVLLFGAFFITFLISQSVISPAWIIISGLMLGYAVISEYPSVLIAGIVFIYACLVLPDRRWIIVLILSGLPPGLLLMAYDWAIFRNILPLGYNYSELYKDNVHADGFISLVGPNLQAMWGITFGSFRGIFFVSPILLLAFPGFIKWWQSGKYRGELIVCIGAVISFFLFNGSSVMWHGGFGVGPRYLVPMLPFMATGLGIFILSWKDKMWAKLLVMILGSWSFLVIWVETIGGQRFPDWTPNPLFNYSLPKILSNDIARNLGMALGLSGIPSLIPLIAILAILTVLWFALNQKFRHSRISGTCTQQAGNQ